MIIVSHHNSLSILEEHCTFSRHTFIIKSLSLIIMCFQNVCNIKWNRDCLTQFKIDRVYLQSLHIRIRFPSHRAHVSRNFELTKLNVGYVVS